MSELKWTGERLLTTVNDNNTVEHLHRYAFAQPLVTDKVVLDIACGEGYGSFLLSKKAKQVIGVDIAPEAIKHAEEKYKERNIVFKTGSVLNIPLEDQSVDIVVSFETIEHLAEQDQMIIEISRVLKSDGILIISTPDKKNYTDGRNYINPFHIKEFYFDEFKSALSKKFSKIEILFQNEFYGSYIIDHQKNLFLDLYMGNFENISNIEVSLDALYFIAIASNVELPILKNSIFQGNKYWIQEIHRLNQNLIKKETALDQVLQSKPYRIGSYILAPFVWIKNLWKL